MDGKGWGVYKEKYCDNFGILNLFFSLCDALLVSIPWGKGGIVQRFFWWSIIFTRVSIKEFEWQIHWDINFLVPGTISIFFKVSILFWQKNLPVNICFLIYLFFCCMTYISVFCLSNNLLSGTPSGIIFLSICPYSYSSYKL